MHITHSYLRRTYLSKETPTTDPPVTFGHVNTRLIPKIFVVCNHKDPESAWGHYKRQQGLTVILETSPDKAIDHWSSNMPDIVILDVDVAHQDRMGLYRKFRAVSTAPILLLLPAYHETEILEAYAAGADDVLVKPISPPIFLAKLMAWVRHSWAMPVDSLNLMKAGKYRLDPSGRCLVDPNEVKFRLTDLEFRLLHVLMYHPGHIYSAEEISRSVWGGYDSSNQVLLKNVVYRLRKKIELDPSHPLLLQTERGGYSFQGQGGDNPRTP